MLSAPPAPVRKGTAAVKLVTLELVLQCQAMHYPLGTFQLLGGALSGTETPTSNRNVPSSADSVGHTMQHDLLARRRRDHTMPVLVDGHQQQHVALGLTDTLTRCVNRQSSLNIRNLIKPSDI